jgi:hypothetical protein
MIVTLHYACKPNESSYNNLNKPITEPCWETGQVIGNKNSSSKVTNRDLCFEKCLNGKFGLQLLYQT